MTDFFSQEHLLIYVLVGGLFILGFIGNVIPVLPSGLFVLGGILLHKMLLPEQSVSWNFVLLAVSLCIFMQVVDLLFSYWGARKFGGTWRSGVGGAVGVILGPIFLTPLIGFFVGPLIGAFTGEMLGGSSAKEAGRAGVGTIVGGFFAFFIRLLCLITMVIGFFVALP